jgi:hypothetical protein
MNRLFQRSVATAALLSLLAAPLSFAQSAQTAPSVSQRADPLLSVDLNRTEIVGRLMTQWQADVGAPQRDSFKQKLAGLRADRLLAVSLVGSFDGVLQVLYGQERADQAAVARNTLSGLGNTRESQKALGDANIDLVYTPLTPCRLFDTRTGQSSALGTIGGIFAPNTRRTVSPAGACGVPASGVKSLVMGFTTRNSTPNTGGYLAVVAPSAAITATVDIFNLGSEWSASNIIAPTSGSGQFDVFVNTATADVVMDIVGYFAPPPQPIGDITEVNTGTATTTGLTGGVTSGIATLSLANGFKLPQSCATGQTPSYNSGTGLWSCSTPSSSTGTVTSINTGTGLTGGPISTTGTIGLTANQLLPTTACASGQVAKWNGSAWICAADDAGPANAFVQGGNTFSALGAGVASVLGNNDNRPLTIKAPQSTIKLLVDPANGDDGLRISYAPDGTAFFGPSPNIVNGSGSNSVASGQVGATIAGGGFVGGGNQVTGYFGTVGGGVSNTAGQNAVVAGGVSNQATGVRAVVSGGEGNDASGAISTIAGGSLNVAAGSLSFAAGTKAKANHDYSFVWGSEPSANTTSTGPKQFVIRANGGIRLPGAGENEPANPAKQSGTNMFTHVVPASGPCTNTGPFGASRTAIDHPLTNDKADAILMVTPSSGALSAGAPGYSKPVVVFYDDTGSGFCPVGRWVIANPNGDQNMLAGMKFNVFVINP